MLNSDYFSIGYVSKTRGLKGELQIYLEVDNPQDYKNMESLFLEINQKPVPFFISNVKKNLKLWKFEVLRKFIILIILFYLFTYLVIKSLNHLNIL